MENEKGDTLVDLGIAIIVFVIFSVTIASLSYNLYLSNTEAKRTAVALNYCVDIFENIGRLDFDDVNAGTNEDPGKIFEIDDLRDFVQESVSTDNGIQTIKGRIRTYNFELEIEDYNNEHIIKIITLKVTYAISRDNEEKIELQRIKVKDI